MWSRLRELFADPQRPFVHRDFSWLQFNDRVLAEARSSENPLLERLKFLGITSSNLDEFFMIRVASLDREILTAQRNPRTDPKVLNRLVQTRSQIMHRCAQFHRRQSQSFNNLRRLLAREKVFISRRFQQSDRIHVTGEQIFYSEVAPLLPALERFEPDSLSELTNLQSIVIFPNGQFLKIPKNLPNVLWIDISSKEFALFFTDDLVRYFIRKAYGIKGLPMLLRLTRDADVSVEANEEDPALIPDAVRKKIRSRDVGRPVRAQISGNRSLLSKTNLSKILRIEENKIFDVQHPFLLHGAYEFANELVKDARFKSNLTYPEFKPVIPKAFVQTSEIFENLRKHDFLLHQPYDSFDAYINFIEEAAEDPDVISIQQTVYRIDKLSHLMQILKKAAATKKIRVFIEPRARFDEIQNLQLAEDLRTSGVDVKFAFGPLKLHAKVALVTRREEGKLVNYTHLSTGNYNAKTARLYTDMAIFSANQEVGEDAKLFFEVLNAAKLPENFGQFKRLVVAPIRLHKRLISLIQAETTASREGKPARIFAKMNTLVDQNVVNSLYEASKAGVRIDLNVRGACSLLPKIKGLSENIRVISIVDRFLEHTRIYYFQNSKIIYLSSADWMPRNFFKRLKLAFPILDPAIYEFIRKQVIPTYLRDRQKAWELTSKGVWRRRRSSKVAPVSRAQSVFQALALKSYRGTELDRH